MTGDIVKQYMIDLGGVSDEQDEDVFDDEIGGDQSEDSDGESDGDRDGSGSHSSEDAMNP